MTTFLIILTMLVAVLLVAVILVQNSKGSGLAGAFGSMGATQTLGVRRTADCLSNATTVLAATFMILCVVTEFVGASCRSSEVKESVIQKNAPKAT